MKPIIDQEMAEAALFALQNEKLVLGESVWKFEEEFAQFCGMRCGVSTSSGTGALQIALQALGIAPKDEVLTTPFSFIATSNSILHTGARAIFSDVEESGFNLDPQKVMERTSPRTRAIVPVDLYGHPCRIDEFRDVCDDMNLKLVEDACQAHGAQYDGKAVGSYADVACFSFDPSKNMTVCGDGGMTVTDDETVAEAARSLRDCGRVSRYEMSRIGYTSRLNTINAAIGRVQLRRLSQWNETRRRIAEWYRRQLEGVEQLLLPPRDKPAMRSVYHLFVARSNLRSRIIEHLSANGTESGVHYPIPIHLQIPYRQTFGYSEGMFPFSERLAHEVLSLPMHPLLTEDDVLFISDIVKEAIRSDPTGS